MPIRFLLAHTQIGAASGCTSASSAATACCGEEAGTAGGADEALELELDEVEEAPEAAAAGRGLKKPFGAFTEQQEHQGRSLGG